VNPNAPRVVLLRTKAVVFKGNFGGRAVLGQILFVRRRAMNICKLILAGAPMAVMPLVTVAHDAPTGWRYDLSCCSGIDCRQIASDDLKEQPDVYFITIGHATVPYNDTRIKNSPDGNVHWCTVNGRDDGKTICLYIPPKAY